MDFFSMVTEPPRSCFSVKIHLRLRVAPRFAELTEKKGFAGILSAPFLKKSLYFFYNH